MPAQRRPRRRSLPRSVRFPPPPPPPPVAPPPAPPAPAPEVKPAPAPVAAAPKAAPRPEGAPLRAAVEVGAWITSRHLSYSGDSPAGSTPLRTFDASAVFNPGLRLEVYPGAFTDTRPLLAGIGAYLDYWKSVGLKVKPPSGSTEGDHDGSMSALDFGLLWRLRPFTSTRLELAPALSYRSLSVTTSDAGGVHIAGLPDTKLSGVELRLDAIEPLGDRFVVMGGLGYTLWSSAKDLVKGGFFPGGSAYGLGLEGGLSYRFWGPLSAKGLLEFQNISYSLKSDPTGTYKASSATDSYFGLRATIRADF